MRKCLLQVCSAVTTIAVVFVRRINRFLSDGWRYVLAGATKWRWGWGGGGLLQRGFKPAKDKDSEVMGSL